MKRVLAILICLGVAAGASPAFAQGATSGAIAGVVSDADGSLPGATVTAVHVPTGTRYSGATDAEGRYNFPYVRVGGPYTITATLAGFQDEELADVYVNLGEQTRIDVILVSTFGEEVMVTAESNPILTSSHVGTASNISQQVIEALPSVDRGFDELVRTNPFVIADSGDDGATTVQIAGRNNRYNNIQIDGSVNNDLFGLADTGVPGGQAETQPISIDALKEIKVVIAPYDVRQSGFSGGGINAITRSGSNAWAGSVYGFYRDDSFIGDGTDELAELGTFENSEFGFRLGGPIVRDQAFFFVNGEIDERDQPTGWSISGNAGQQFGGFAGGVADEAQAFRQYLIDRYGYDPGGLDQLTRTTDSDKLFGRLDFNLGDSHQLTVRHNYVDAENLRAFPSAFNYEFPNAAYAFQNETNSTVAQLNSVFADDWFNEARIAYQQISDRRGGLGQPFPNVDINSLSDTSLDFQIGTEPFSTRNSLDQDILEIHNDLTFFAGDHEITLGTHNELFTFQNLFIQEAFGSYEFDSIEDFMVPEGETPIADEFNYTYSVDPNPYDEFDVYQLGFYAGDVWRGRDNLSVIFGVRADIPLFPDEPKFNELAFERFGYRTDNTPSEDPIWQPRVGFNYDLTGAGDRQVRGGIGLFYGRLPFVWLSNNYARTGLEQVTLRGFDVPFNPDPFNQPQSLGGERTQEINLVAPDFEMPQVWRMNLGYDHRLPFWGLVATAEVLHTEVEQDILYQNLNLEQTGTAFDGRPTYRTAYFRDFTGAYFISNTDKGNSTNATVKLERTYRDGVFGFASYTWGESEVVTEGTSSRAVSNWQYNEAIDPNNPTLSTSDFEVEHRISASLGYNFDVVEEWPTTVSLYYNLQSGRPVTLLQGTTFDVRGSFNGDFFYYNDPLYVPNPGEAEFVGGSYDDLLNLLSDVGCGGYAGQIVPRNACESPWFHTLDLHVGQGIPIGFGELEATFDILNLANLIDDEWGERKYVSFGTVTPIRYDGMNDDGQPVYVLEDVGTGEQSPWEYDNLRSRWQAKFGLRYTF